MPIPTCDKQVNNEVTEQIDNFISEVRNSLNQKNISSSSEEMDTSDENNSLALNSHFITGNYQMIDAHLDKVIKKKNSEF